MSTFELQTLCSFYSYFVYFQKTVMISSSWLVRSTLILSIFNFVLFFPNFIIFTFGVGRSLGKGSYEYTNYGSNVKSLFKIVCLANQKIVIFSKMFLRKICCNWLKEIWWCNWFIFCHYLRYGCIINVFLENYIRYIDWI